MILSSDLHPEASPAITPGQRGFSLIELAIVMVILGLMLGTMLIPLSTQRDLSNRKATETLLDEVHDALLGFAAAHGRLPCPATNASNGQAAPTGAATTCTQPHGLVPARTLGLSGTFDANNRLLDAWNNPIYYSLSLAGSGSYSNAITLNTGPASLRICQQSSCTATTIVAEQIVAVIHSRGADGAQTPASPDQLANTDLNNDFVSTTLREDPATGFDDLLRWLSPSTLTYALLRSGQLDSP